LRVDPVTTTRSDRGLRLNECDLLRGTQPLAGRTEAEIYRALALPLIPPQLREGWDEIAAARKGRLPNLLELTDIRGELHMHSNASDGVTSIAAMAKAAQALGYRYTAITDHGKRLEMTHGLDAKRLARQIDQIEKLNTNLRNLALASIEVDILEGGSLDLRDSTLRRLDLVVTSIHSHFDLPVMKWTERILRAMDNRRFDILHTRPVGCSPGVRAMQSIWSASRVERSNAGAISRWTRSLTGSTFRTHIAGWRKRWA
jgi:DNA polymerase (family X)